MSRSIGGSLFSNSNTIKFAILVSALFMGCQRAPTRWEPGAPFVTQVALGTNSEAPLQVVQLFGVKDSKTLRGDVVEFKISPGEKREGNNKGLVGQAPVARFIESRDGVMIPADVLTLQMTSLYFHLQSLKKLESKVLPKGGLTWPRHVGLRALALDPASRFNNAFYGSELDVLYFVPYTQNQLPVPLNAGVIGHEHFHAYFAKQVILPLRTKKKSVYLDYVLKSLNEGLADVWGWLYTGDPDFIALSMPQLLKKRTLEIQANSELHIKPESLLRAEAFEAQQLCPNLERCKSANQLTIDEAYENGTELARLIKAVTYSIQKESKISFEALRVQMGQQLMTLLHRIEILAQEDNLSLEQVVIEWHNIAQVKSPQDCEMIKSALSSKKMIDQVCLKH